MAAVCFGKCQLFYRAVFFVAKRKHPLCTYATAMEVRNVNPVVVVCGGKFRRLHFFARIDKLLANLFPVQENLENIAAFQTKRKKK